MVACSLYSTHPQPIHFRSLPGHHQYTYSNNTLHQLEGCSCLPKSRSEVFFSYLTNAFILGERRRCRRRGRIEGYRVHNYSQLRCLRPFRISMFPRKTGHLRHKIAYLEVSRGINILYRSRSGLRRVGQRRGRETGVGVTVTLPCLFRIPRLRLSLPLASIRFPTHQYV